MKLYTFIETNFGKLLLLAENHKLTGLYFANHEHSKLIKDFKFSPGEKIFKTAQKQLNEYFNGQRKQFEIEYSFSTGTLFQNKVWQKIANLKFAQTVSYSEIANQINRPKSVRAAANAIGKNPISIIVPCHRIIGKNGKLTGYAGGLELKKKLLQLESN